MTSAIGDRRQRATNDAHDQKHHRVRAVVCKDIGMTHLHLRCITDVIMRRVQTR